MIGVGASVLPHPVEGLPTDLSEGPSQSRVPLFPTRIVGGGVNYGQGRQYDVTRDGRFLINTVVGYAAPTPITLMLNWRPDLKQ